MKNLNKPIKVMAIFYTDEKIEPIKFSLDDKVIKVDIVMKKYKENLVGNRVVFVFIQNEKDIYELKYELDNKVWYLSIK